MAQKPNIHLKYKNKIKVISSDWPYLTFSELKSETHIYFFALVNVSDQVIATKSIKYKNYIHSDGNLCFLSVPIPEFQSSAVDLSITNCTSYWSPNHCSIIHFCTYMFLAAVGTPYSLFMSPPVRVGRHCFCLGWLSVCLSVTKSCLLCNLKTVQGIFMKFYTNIKGKGTQNTNEFCLKVFGKLHILMHSGGILWILYFI